MSPVGYWPQLHAAIEAGADAVYFGLKHFTARAKVGFGSDELPEVMRTLHRRGVKGYVTFNTLAFAHELPTAAESLAQIAAAGADAIIVQDLGLARLAHVIAPELEIHGSTQMSITSAEGVELARRFGVSRVVLARELSVDEVRQIRAATPLELEVFVHGALCVSYSGQCFSSEAWGGRSANRGQCAQACRLPYELLVDSAKRPLGDARYLLSPGDLSALDHIPALVELGIAALKIEGRYKDADYVALTTAAYRAAVDAAWEQRPLDLTPAARIGLEQVYSRGLGDYFIGGTDHQKVVRGRAPRHRGVLVGKVMQLHGETVLVAPDAQVMAAAPIKPGDGVVFDAADWRSPEESEEGGRIYHVHPTDQGWLALEFAYGALNPARIRPGDLLWRTHDPELDRTARPYTQAAAPLRRQAVSVAVTAHEGAPLELRWQLVDRPDLTVMVRSPEPLPAAANRPAAEAYLREQLGRLGNTPYQLAALKLDLRGTPFAPSSLLNQLRRSAVEQLAELQARPLPIQVGDAQAALAALSNRDQMPKAPVEQPQLHLLVRSGAQLAAAIAAQPASITLDYLELYGLRPAVEQVQAAGIEARVASPRILKPAEQRVVHFLLKLECPILVRSGGLLEALRHMAATPKLIGDFSLNAANALSADVLLDLGLERLTPTHDLNAAQIADLTRELGSARIELIAYQHLPVFHTEHCVFCRFLSDGTSYKDCGRPCERHEIALRDQNGRAHPVLADVGCRNTVFGAEAQEASRHLDMLLAAGVRHFRLEFVHETAEQVTQVSADFAAALRGTITSAELGERLRRAAPQGVTEGSLFVPGNYLAVPLMQ
ncbi:MAG: U32 family peptidase [Oscillochloris sp.]|nr:U32 family peptidase [Oscillochloris sp.]